jgi:hypothetical protein
MHRVLLIVIAWCGVARAGMICMDPAEVEGHMKLVERFAKDPSVRKQLDDGYPWLCVTLAADKLAARIAPACEAILDRDGELQGKEPHPCAVAAAAAGVAILGKHDLVPLVTAMPENPLDLNWGMIPSKTRLLARMGDPRGARVIVDMWREAIPRADQREKRHGNLSEWSAWRQQAAHDLGELGGADDAAFLREQAKATIDPHVRDACLDGAKRIDKRLHP